MKSPLVLGATCPSAARHLVVCVHGLNGNQYDLRTLRLALLTYHPTLSFLMFNNMGQVIYIYIYAPIDIHLKGMIVSYPYT